jgi:hypothetical protein
MVMVNSADGFRGSSNPSQQRAGSVWNWTIMLQLSMCRGLQYIINESTFCAGRFLTRLAVT